MRIFLLFFICFLSTMAFSQRVMLIEKKNKARTQKLYEGDYIQYRLADDEQWYAGEIFELRDDIQAITFDDRLVNINNITSLRQRRSWPRALGYTLLSFGAAWSGFALIGTATDGDPSTNYRWSDAGVSAVSMGTGALLPLLFGNKTMKIGDGQRTQLRIIDISF